MKCMNKNNIIHLAEAFLYVLLLVFFTYSAVLSHGLKSFSHFWSEYVQNQGSLFALVTNYGLLFLLIIDNAYSGKRPHDNWLPQMGAFTLVSIFTFVHARVVAHPDVYSNYAVLLKMPFLFAVMHLSLLGYLVYVKYQSLKEFTVSPV